MSTEKQLVDALRIIAAHEVAGPLTQNDDNVSLSDLPFYVAGKAHAELSILHNIARNALDAYETRPSVTAQPRFFIDHGQIHDRDTGKHITTDEDTVFCDGINHCLALLNELAALPVQVSPDLIEKLGKLANYLTEQGEYEACDLIDTVVERLTPKAKG